MRGLFITGTGTGVGKTVVAAAIAAALTDRGEPVAASKPVVTGLEEPPDPTWPRDHELLASITGARPEEVAPYRFGPPVSPHLAAELTGTALQPAAIVDGIARRADGRVAIVEGAGGLLVPITTGYSMRDLARDLGLPVIIAAHPGLGTINHTLLTIEASRAVGLDVASVVLTPWPAEPDTLLESNRDTIARLGAVDVALLPHLDGPAAGALSAAGAALPLRLWLGAR
jgi:dethiobiotin synthetase